MREHTLVKRFQRDILLKNHTTFRIGGPANYFFEAESKQDIIEAVKWVEENTLAFFVLGGGSNLLVSDEGFGGLVIKMQNAKCKVQNENSKCKIIYAEAGVKLADLVELSLEQGLTGLEWAAGIPRATVGGAIKINASAFGSSMYDIVKKVEVFGDESIIVSTLLELKRGDKKEIQKQIDYVLDYRKKNHPMQFPSAGCIFKNYESRIMNYGLLNRFLRLKKFDKTKVIPAGFLIEQCDLKGRKIGKAQISDKHANFIVNLGGASAKDVLALIDLAKREVKNKFNIELNQEIQILRGSTS